MSFPTINNGSLNGYTSFGSINTDSNCILKKAESFYLDCNDMQFIQLVTQLINQGIDPNLRFQEASLGDDVFQDVTFFHLVYLYWKNPGKAWDHQTNEAFQKAIDRMLDDKRTDLRAIFTEDSRCDTEHFFNHDSPQNWHRRNDEDGYLMERMTILHYATLIEDSIMVDKVLQRAPELLDRPCCMVKGKNLLSEEVLFISDLTNSTSEGLVADIICEGDSKRDEYLRRLKSIDDQVFGELARATVDLRLTEGMLCEVSRTVKVTPLHLAARLGNEILCGYLVGKGASRIARDSSNCDAIDYFKLSLAEKLVVKSKKSCAQLVDLLHHKDQLIRQPYLPQAFSVQIREGYDIVYDSRTKVASFVRERLRKSSLVNQAVRANRSFRVDADLPKENRATIKDFTNSGFDKGHLAAAGNASSSEKAMSDTFLLSNIAPQDPELNQRYWKSFENKIRDAVNQHDLIEVFTGCLFLPAQWTDGKTRVTYEVIGNGQVAVPTHFFKVLYFYKGPSSLSTAYIIPNKEIPPNTPFSEFQVTVEHVQKLSGIMFNQWRS